MAKKLTKGKRQYLLHACRHAAYLTRKDIERTSRAQQEALGLRQLRSTWLNTANHSSIF